MFHADHADFKWPMKRFKDYLIGQMARQNVTVHLDTRATPELIAQGNFDAVIAAVGAVAAKPPVEGAESPEVLTPLQVFGNDGALGQRVIVVGGSETGTETALYLARCGHQVTVLTRRDRLATDAQGSHYYGSLMAALQEQTQLQAICRAVTRAVSPHSVTYTDGTGTSHTLEADSVVACGGMTPLQQEAMAFASAAPRFFAIGDCSRVGNIHTCTRGAFSAAMQI